MKIKKFILSASLNCRWQRHLMLWFGIFLFKLTWMICINLVTTSETLHFSLLLNLTLPTLSLLVFDMVYCYSTIYWFLPRFFSRKRYVTFAFGVIALTIICVVIRCVIFLHIYHVADKPFEIKIVPIWFNALVFFNSGPPVICAIFLALKMLKLWYIEEDKKLELTRQKMPTRKYIC